VTYDLHCITPPKKKEKVHRVRCARCVARSHTFFHSMSSFGRKRNNGGSPSDASSKRAKVSSGGAHSTTDTTRRDAIAEPNGNSENTCMVRPKITRFS
jgi:hypothetical protein